MNLSRRKFLTSISSGVALSALSRINSAQAQIGMSPGLWRQVRPAIALVGSTTAQLTGSTNTTYTLATTGLTGGSDTQARVGDLLIISTGFNTDSNGNPGITNSTLSWTEAADLYEITGFEGTNLSVNWAYANVTPPTSVTINTVASRSSGSVLMVFRYVDPSNPLDVAITTATGTSSNRPNPPAITPATNGSAIVIVGGTAQADGSVDVTSAPTGYSGFSVANARSSTWDFSAAMAYRLNNSAGVSVDPAAFNATSYTNASWAAVTIALRN